MINKLIASVAPFLFLLCACGSERQKTEIKNVTDADKPIVVAITRDMPGYFVVGGERYGYPYELLNAYGADKGREIQIQDDQTRPALLSTLSNGQMDIIVSLVAETGESGTMSLPLYSTTYVVMASARNAAQYRGHGESIADILGDNMVIMSPGFENTDSYDMLLDSLRTAMLYVSPKGGFELADALADNVFDLLICEKSEALLAEELLHNVAVVYEFDEQVPVCLTFGAADKWLYDDFCEWIDGYRGTKNYAALNSIYLEKGFASQFPRINKPNRVVGGISVWDDLIREVGEKEGVDWRLLSAIAYNESRFRADVESGKGAKGLMQIMPVTARFFKMENSDLHDPRISLTIGARLVKTMENMLDFPEGTSEEDRLGITLAAYNSGIGIVTEARKITSAMDEDPNSWEAVSKYLVLMGTNGFEAPITYRYRNYRGSGETLAFVGNVIQRYDTYRSSVK